MSERQPRAQALQQWLNAQPTILGDGWTQTLGERKQEEASFHDLDRAATPAEAAKPEANHRFYSAATVVTEYIGGWIAMNAVGSRFLDYGCGNGRHAIDAATGGASIAVGIDLSAVSVENAKRAASAAGVGDRTTFLQRDCESTGFPDGSFDAVICSGMLHHVDLSGAYAELNRILDSGGRILCVEALGYNPLIQLYRRLTPGLRTKYETEHILTLESTRLARQFFDVSDMRFHLLVSPLATLLPKGRARRIGVQAGEVLDRYLTAVPGLRLWSWMFSFQLNKR